MIVNDKGKPLGCKIDKSSCHDLKLIDETIEKIDTKVIVGDKGYTSKLLKDRLEKRGIKMSVPYKK